MCRTCLLHSILHQLCKVLVLESLLSSLLIACWWFFFFFLFVFYSHLTRIRQPAWQGVVRDLLIHAPQPPQQPLQRYGTNHRPEGNRNPWLSKPNQWNPPKEKAPKPASEPHKPPPNTHLALNTRRQNPSQATDKPCPGELHHKKSITPVLGLSLATGASRNKRNPVRGALASQQIKLTSERKSSEDKRKDKRKTRKEKQRKDKRKTKETVLSRSPQLPPPFPPRQISNG